MELDILALGAHPDDVELSCGGTLIGHIKKGYKVGVIDFTQGEMGTRGTVAMREEEANNAAKIMGISVRENLKFRDAHFEIDEAHKLALIQAIRKYRPKIVLANAKHDRHPDHPRASKLAFEACFLSGLKKINTFVDGKDQEAWRPKSLHYYIQSINMTPDFYVDVSDSWEEKMEAIRAYKSQFYNPESQEPETYISKPAFIEMLEARGREYGHAIGVKYAEGFVTEKIPGINSLFDLK